MDKPESTREARVKQLLADCERARDLILFVTKDVNPDDSGYITTEATRIVNGIPNFTRKQSAFIMACLRVMEIAVCKHRNEHRWAIDGDAEITTEMLEKALIEHGSTVFTLRGNPNDPYDLQEIQVTHVQGTDADRIQSLEQQVAILTKTVAQKDAELNRLRPAVSQIANVAQLLGWTDQD